MPTKIHDINCPGCGAPQDVSTRICKFCGAPVIITTFNAVSDLSLPLINRFTSSYQKSLSEDANIPELHVSVALCYWKLKFYDKALENFQKAIEQDFDNADLYFYAAVCALGGKLPFYAKKPEIAMAEKYLEAAISIEPKGIYYFLWANISFEYYARKNLLTPQPHDRLHAQAMQVGVSEADKLELKKMLGDS